MHRFYLSIDTQKMQAHFVRSGYIHMHIGYLSLTGVRGNYWAISNGDALYNAYNLYLNASDVNASHGPDYRYLGYSLRCLQE